MAKIFVTIGIIALILLVLFSICFYVGLKLHQVFGFNKWAWVMILFSVIVFFVMVSMINARSSNFFGRGLYFLFAFLIGVIFFSLFSFLVLDLVNLVSGFNIDYKLGGYIIVGAIILISVFSVVNAQFVRTKHIEVSAHVKEDLRIVQLTDVHLGAVHGPGYLKKVVEKVNAAEPDIVVITGDLFDGSRPIDEELIAPLKELKAKNKYFVTGNHEQYVGVEKAIDLVKKVNFSVLENEVVEVKGIQIVGLNNPESDFKEENVELKEIGGKINKNKVSVLLYHPPTGFDDAVEANITLQLSGHLHKGQMFPINLIDKIFAKTPYGLYKKDNTTFYASSGTGTWGPPMRFLSNSEIVVVDLKKKS